MACHLRLSNWNTLQGRNFAYSDHIRQQGFGQPASALQVAAGCGASGRAWLELEPKLCCASAVENVRSKKIKKNRMCQQKLVRTHRDINRLSLSSLWRPSDCAGADLLAAWYQRKIRIYHDIVKLIDSPNDRILVHLRLGRSPRMVAAGGRQ